MNFTGTISGDGYAIITTPSELREIGNNGGDPDAKMRLGNIVDLTFTTTDPSGDDYNGGDGWAPVPVNYQGELDLNGFGITGLTFDRDSGFNGLLTNLTDAYVHDGFIEGNIEQTGQQIGLLSDAVTGCTFRNIITKGSVTSTRSNQVSAGGLVGAETDCVFYDCVNEADIISTDNQGRVGGLVGLSERSSVDTHFIRCINRGSIQSDHSLADVGPIMGGTAGGLNGARHSNCFNDRDLSGYADINLTGNDIYNGVANKSTSDLQDLETYTVTYNASQVGTVTTSGTTVTQVSGADFSTLSAGNTVHIIDTPFVIDSITNDTELELTTTPPTYASAVEYSFGTGSKGLTEAFDMVTLSNYVDETWGIDDGNAFPQLSWEINQALTPSVTFKDATGTAIEGAVVQFFTIDAFDAKSPAITNLTEVGSEYTTDASGVATYDPNTDPAVDGTKVYGAIALDATAGDTEMEPIIGISIGRQNVDLTLP